MIFGFQEGFWWGFSGDFNGISMGLFHREWDFFFLWDCHDLFPWGVCVCFMGKTWDILGGIFLGDFQGICPPHGDGPPRFSSDFLGPLGSDRTQRGQFPQLENYKMVNWLVGTGCHEFGLFSQK